MISFLKGLDEDIRKSLIAQIRNLWTHSSTAIEGNTLTLGETAFVIDEGLTVSGKPLKDHQEVVGHARAIELIYNMIEKNTPVSDKDLFDLHKSIQTSVIVDVYKPIGGWKKEPNGTYMIDGDKQLFYEYASPSDVPVLMEKWLNLLNSKLQSHLSQKEAAHVYSDLHISFVHIHPFFDGNGRMARLIANLPVLKSGYPPILIPKLLRREYIRSLSQYEIASGTPSKNEALLNMNKELDKFREFCVAAWKDAIDLVKQAHLQQEKRSVTKNV